jgi:hypothetical protein
LDGPPRNKCYRLINPGRFWLEGRFSCLIEWSASKNKSRSGETFQKSHRNLACSFVGRCSHVSRSPFQHGESHSPRPNVVVDVVLHERLFIQLNDDTIMKKNNNNIKRQRKKYKRTDATTCLQTRLYSIAYSELCLRIIYLIFVASRCIQYMEDDCFQIGTSNLEDTSSSI